MLCRISVGGPHGILAWSREEVRLSIFTAPAWQACSIAKPAISACSPELGVQESVKSEKNILMMVNSPFIIKLYETYNGSQGLYFLMEAALGGELFATYNRKSFFGSTKHGQFYVAGATCALEYLHSRRIIYRRSGREHG